MSQADDRRPWTVGELLEWTTRFLDQRGMESPRLEAQILLASVLDCKRIDLYGAKYSEVAGTDQRARYRELIQQRVEGCPVSHLVGKKEFFSLEFEVSSEVLTPRPDSEVLVVACLDLARKIVGPRILDLGTGSGNLIIALAKNLPSAQLTAVDISPAALAIARRNAERHLVQDRIEFLLGDLFTPLAAEARFDVIVSNPPYIPSRDIAQLAPEVRNYDPTLALDGGEDGFDIIQNILQKASSYLVPGGTLLVEIGSDQEALTRQTIGEFPHFSLESILTDGQGLPRAFQARAK